MANLFKNVGFPFMNQDDIEAFVARAAWRSGSRPENGVGTFTDPVSGARLTIELDESVVVDAVPHFFPVNGAVTWRVSSPDVVANEDAIRGGLACPVNVGEERETWAFVELPEFLAARERIPPSGDVRVHVSCIPVEFRMFPGPEAYEFPMDFIGFRKGLALGGFMCLGCLPGRTELPAQKRSLSVFSGWIRERELLRNSMGGGLFCHVRVESWPGMIDVVISAETLEAVPAIGAPVAVKGILNGTIVT